MPAIGLATLPSSFRIGDLTLDAARQRLHRGADSIHLPPLTFRLLTALIDAAPGVAGHDELERDVWGGRPVSPETVSQRVKLLRDALGDDASNPRYIEVVRGRGYRLIPEVVASTGPATAGSRRLNRAVVVGAVLGLAVVVGIWQFGGSPRPVESQPSIAVLPFVDMSSGQDQEYLADGMAEEILNLLSRSTRIPVIARTSSFSFEDGTHDVADIAQRLGVSHVVEGSIRRSGDQYRVAVKLISAADGTHVWSESYDRKLVDVLQLQDEIARSVAGALEITLLGPPAAASETVRPVNADAYDLYLRGRQRLREFRLGEAERYLEQSLEMDPQLIPAYRALGEAYVRQIVDVNVPIAEYREKLRELLDRGFEHAPDDPGLIGLSGQLERYDGNLDLAEALFRRALAQDPSNPTVQMVYNMLKVDQGYPEEALEIVRDARGTDPLNPLLYLGEWSSAMDMGHAGNALIATERYERLAASGDTAALALRGWAKVVLQGNLAGGFKDWADAWNAESNGATQSHAMPVSYYTLEDLQKGDAARALYEAVLPGYQDDRFVALYRHLVTGEIDEARAMAVPLFVQREDYSASYEDLLIARLATDVLIDRGRAELVITTIDGMAPRYEIFRSIPKIAPEELVPAPYPLKSVYSSYPALYFPDYIRALRAAGEVALAENMLNHLEAILQWRSDRGLLVEQRHVAESRALRGNYAGALDALEQGLEDRTIFHGWHVLLLHNPIFADIRNHPRFMAIIGALREDLRTQRLELAAASGPRGADPARSADGKNSS